MKFASGRENLDLEAFFAFVLCAVFEGDMGSGSIAPSTLN